MGANLVSSGDQGAQAAFEAVGGVARAQELLQGGAVGVGRLALVYHSQALHEALRDGAILAQRHAVQQQRVPAHMGEKPSAHEATPLATRRGRGGLPLAAFRADPHGKWAGCFAASRASRNAWQQAEPTAA